MDEQHRVMTEIMNGVRQRVDVQGNDFVGVTYGRRFHKLVTVTEGRVKYVRGKCGAYLKGRALRQNVYGREACLRCWPYEPEPEAEVAEALRAIDGES